MESASKNENFKEVLLVDKHKHYVKNLDFQRDSFFYWATEHLKVSGVYWGLGAMEMMRSVNEMDRDKIIEFVLSCQQKDGGFGGNIDHDSHLLYTLSAIQVLAILDAMDKVDKEKVVNYVKNLQKEDGSFSGDEWGEIDTRFSYIALCSLALLGRLDAINLDKAVDFILQCKNFDGGFGCVPGAESHAGQIFCCVGALAIAGKLDQIDADLLGWWLAERQIPGGGLNGRPEKLPDVCYSWWVLSSLAALDRLHWINKEKLKNFILECQDEEGGGIGDRPNDVVDVYHTFFGVGGLSLLGYFDLEKIDPVYALCVPTLEKLGVSWKRLKDY